MPDEEKREAKTEETTEEAVPRRSEEESDKDTPKAIVDQLRTDLARGRLGRSRSGVADRVRPLLTAYHQRRGWGPPSDERVMEVAREVLG